MLQAPVESSLRATFFPNSPVLDRRTAHETHARWWRGEALLSSPDVVGQVAMTAAQRAALCGYDMFRTNYTLLSEDHPAVQPFREVTQAFRSVVDFDTKRGNLGSNTRVRVFAGYYRDKNTLTGEPVHLQDWHSDDPQRVEIRYLLHHGVAPLRVALGEVSREDIATEGAGRGDLLPGVIDRLDTGQYELGSVIRFMIDVHASGVGIGNRLVHQATVPVPPLAA